MQNGKGFLNTLCLHDNIGGSVDSAEQNEDGLGRYSFIIPEVPFTDTFIITFFEQSVLRVRSQLQNTINALMYFKIFRKRFFSFALTFFRQQNVAEPPKLSRKIKAPCVGVELSCAVLLVVTNFT